MILPKALTFVPATWLARESNQIYLELLLGEVSASIESLQVANEVSAGHSLPNVLGEPGGEKHRGYLRARSQWWLEKVPQPSKDPLHLCSGVGGQLVLREATFRCGEGASFA